MHTLTIHIRESSNGDGYLYDIYDCDPDEVDDRDSIDGGLCTSTLANAVEMACEQAAAMPAFAD